MRNTAVDEDKTKRRLIADAREMIKAEDDNDEHLNIWQQTWCACPGKCYS